MLPENASTLSVVRFRTSSSANSSETALNGALTLTSRALGTLLESRSTLPVNELKNGEVRSGSRWGPGVTQKVEFAELNVAVTPSEVSEKVVIVPTGDRVEVVERKGRHRRGSEGS
jgi:hypothetical protein